MKLLSVALLALERVLKATEIAERVKHSPDGEGVKIAKGVELFSRRGDLVFIPRDGR